MLWIAAIGGFVAWLLASMWAMYLAEKVDGINAETDRVIKQIDGQLADLDKRLRERPAGEPR